MVHAQMEFDLGLEIQLHRVDLVVTCELSCIFKNEYLTKVPEVVSTY